MRCQEICRIGLPVCPLAVIRWLFSVAFRPLGPGAAIAPHPGPLPGGKPQGHKDTSLFTEDWWTIQTGRSASSSSNPADQGQLPFGSHTKAPSPWGEGWGEGERPRAGEDKRQPYKGSVEGSGRDCFWPSGDIAPHPGPLPGGKPQSQKDTSLFTEDWWKIQTERSASSSSNPADQGQLPFGSHTKTPSPIGRGLG
jgi:hypothetical protein